jgi:hypothetical protein
MEIPNRAILESKILSTWKLDSLRAGRHVLRNERNYLIGESWIVGSWIAYIMPSFEPTAALAVVHEKERVRGAFAFTEKSLDQTENISIIQVDFPATWVDTVTQTLQNFELFNQSGGLSLDGIGYLMLIDTWVARAEIEFSNPQTHSFVALEKSLFQVAQEITQLSGDHTQYKIIKTWREYLKK